MPAHASAKFLCVSECVRLVEQSERKVKKRLFAPDFRVDMQFEVLGIVEIVVLRISVFLRHDFTFINVAIYEKRIEAGAESFGTFKKYEEKLQF